MQGVDCLFLFYRWGHNETGCEKPVVLLQEPCVSCVWAQGWPISGTWGPPRLPPPVQVHTGHSHLRMLSWTCASPSPTPVQENSLQGRADSSGQGSSMYQKWFFFPSMVLPKYFKSFNSCLHHNSLEKPHSQERLLCSDFTTDIFLFPSLKMGVLCTLCF